MADRRRRKSLVDLQRLRAFLESIKSVTEDFIFGPSDGGPLYHYTDLGGLHGVVTNRDLWLNNARYSNDDEEMTHGYRVAKLAIEAARAEPSNDPNWALYLAAVADLIEK